MKKIKYVLSAVLMLCSMVAFAKQVTISMYLTQGGTDFYADGKGSIIVELNEFQNSYKVSPAASTSVVTHPSYYQDRHVLSGTQDFTMDDSLHAISATSIIFNGYDMETGLPKRYETKLLLKCKRMYVPSLSQGTLYLNLKQTSSSPAPAIDACWVGYDS